MNDSRSAVRSPMNPTLSLENMLPTAYQRYGALAICAALIVAASVAGFFGNGPGPESKPFVLVAATVWSLADLLTAFLLLVQFYVNGTVRFAVLAVAYAFSSLMTWAYLAAFPGIFRTAPLTLGDQQVATYLWTIWHSSFPLLVICAMLNGTALRRIVSRRKIQVATALSVAAPAGVASGVSALVFAYRDRLPHVVLDGHLAPLWQTGFVPLVITLNALACVVLLTRRRRLTALALWLAVATFSETLDALLNLNTARYSYAWDTGKIITVFTSSVVLVMILCDIAGLYGQLARVARVDVLTSLANRRAFKEHFQFVFGNARRLRGRMALLVIDIDFVMRLNDSYKHPAADECLQQVARVLATCATRPLDLVARYGGERFAVVLPDTPQHGVLTIAERIRASVEQLEILHDAQLLERVTVSIGVGYAHDARNVDAATLFKAADRAVFDAKDSGRNKVVLGSLDARASELQPLAPAT